MLIFLLSLLANSALSLDLDVGIQGGLNVGDLSYEPETPTETHQSLVLGALGELHLNDIFSFVLQVNHYEKGATYYQLNTDFTDVYEYLEFPLLFRVRPFSWKINPYFELGIAYGYKLNAKQKRLVVKGITERAIKDAKTTATAIRGGGGFEMPLSTRFLIFLGTSYSKSLTRLASPDSSSPKALDWQSVLGVKFRN